jgi:hypothetical protein
MTIEIDSILSGIIILLLILVIWKWYNNRSSCSKNGRLSCGCRRGDCRCGGDYMPMGVSTQDRVKCSCGCNPRECICRPNCICQCNAGQRDYREGLETKSASHGVSHVTGGGPILPSGAEISQNAGDYQEITKQMGVDSSVGDSHTDWCSNLMTNGISTGASSCTTLEETGRSYGTADFVGLTARKWCKARQLATPADDARVTPSQYITEWCDIDMDELV